MSISKTVIHESLHVLLSYLLHTGAITTSDSDSGLAMLAEAYAFKLQMIPPLATFECITT